MSFCSLEPHSFKNEKNWEATHVARLLLIADWCYWLVSTKLESLAQLLMDLAQGFFCEVTLFGTWAIYVHLCLPLEVLQR